MASISPYNIPRLRYLVCAGRKENEETLTQEEKRLYKILQKVNPSSAIGKSISIGISKGPETFRKLVGELIDQMNDAENNLKSVIGEDGIEALRNLRRS